MQSPPPGPPPPLFSNTATASFMFSLTSTQTPTLSPTPTLSSTSSETSTLSPTSTMSTSSTQTPTSTYYPSLTSTPSYLLATSSSTESSLNLTTILGASSGSIVSALTLIAGFIHRKKLRGTCCGKRISLTVEPATEDTEKGDDTENSDKAEDKSARSDSQTTAALAIAAITKIATDHKHHGHS